MPIPQYENTCKKMSFIQNAAEIKIQSAVKVSKFKAQKWILKWLIYYCHDTEEKHFTVVAAQDGASFHCFIYSKSCSSLLHGSQDKSEESRGLEMINGISLQICINFLDSNCQHYSWNIESSFLSGRQTIS